MLKYSTKFSIRATGDKPAKVRLRISYDSIRPEVYTGVSVLADEWNDETQRTNIKNDKRNIDLDKQKRIIDEIFSEFEIIQKRYPDKDELISLFNHRKTIKGSSKEIDKPLLITEIVDRFIDNVGELDQWTKANYNRFNKLKHHFEFYNPKLNIEKITEKDLIGFVRYFQTNPINKKTGEPDEPHKNTTVSRTMKDVRAVLKWANKKGFYQGNLHETFYPKFKGANFDLNEPIFFSWDELMKFYNHEFEANQRHLEETRDIIAFCCFSSLRYSDAKNLRKSLIKSDFFYTTTQKTTDALKIDLNDYSRAILEKYKDVPGKKALPEKSMKEANEQLKVIGQILEFEDPYNYTYFIGEKRYDTTFPKHEVISTHIGRKTFIVNGLFLGIPAEVIMRWTGHKDYNSMKPYIAIVDALKSKEMSKFNMSPKISP